MLTKFSAYEQNIFKCTPAPAGFVSGSGTKLAGFATTSPKARGAGFHRVNIYKANGEVRPVDVGKTLDYTAPARMIYWGARQIMLELGRLDPGDIIEYEIHKKGFTYALLTDQPDEERFVPPMRGQFYDIVPFWCDDPTMPGKK